MSEHTPTAAEMNAQVIAEFREKGGQVGGMFAGAPLILLTTTGARTGRQHTTPVVHARQDGDLLVFATNAGADRDPQWYRNLSADPRATVEQGTGDGRVESLPVTAVALRGADRDRAYARQCDQDPAFTAYQDATSRTIPVLALRPVVLDAAGGRAMAASVAAAHDALREDLAALRAALDAAPEDGPRPAPPRGLAQHCLTARFALRAHHGGEDGAFGLVERAFPHLAPTLERIRHEHRAIAAALTGIESLLPGPDQDEAAPGARVPLEHLREEVTRLTAEIERHFRYEEATLLPALRTAPPGKRDEGDTQ